MKVVFCLEDVVEQSGIAFEDLDEILGSDPPVAGLKERLEKGNIRAVRLTSLARLCEKLGCEPGDLLKCVKD